MPRFGIRTLLIVVAAIALWLSTFADYSGSEDVRAFIILACVITSGAATYFYTERRRAFWLGFFGTMIMFGTRIPFTTLGARFQWAIELARYLPEYFGADVNGPGWGHWVTKMSTTFIFIAMLIASTVTGLLCVYVYDQSRKTEKV